MLPITDLKRIDHVIDRSGGRPQSEYWGYYEDQLIGVKSTNSACEKMLDAYAYDLLSGDLCIPASRLDGVCGDCEQTLDSMGLCGCRDEEPQPVQSGLCWCITWHEQGGAGECPDCRWLKTQDHAPPALAEYQDDQDRYRDAEADEPSPWQPPTRPSPR